MRIIARNTLATFWAKHPETRAPLQHWIRLTAAARWHSPHDVLAVLPKAKTLTAERVRFEVAGGNYRLIVAFDFGRQIAFMKFIGTHAEYDCIDALKVSMF